MKRVIPVVLFLALGMVLLLGLSSLLANATQATSHQGPDAARNSLGLTAPAAAETPYVGAGWRVECVECPRYFHNMGPNSLQLDPGGHPHIAYGGDSLYHAWHDGIAWHSEVVDGSWNAGAYAALFSDTAGYLHISYYDAGNADLKYAFNNGSGWHTETVDSDGNVGEYSSLAVDNEGHVHISYYDATNNDLKYARYDGISWQIETVDSEDVGKFTSLALDGEGRPHIAYHDDTSGSGGSSHPRSMAEGSRAPAITPTPTTPPWEIQHIKYAYYDGTGWQIAKVFNESDAQYLSLALSPAGHPYISYYNGGHHAVMMAYFDGADWQIEVIEEWLGYLAGWSSLAFGADGQPCVTYNRQYPEIGLKYACFDGADWQIETVDNTEGTGWYSSLAFDDQGYAHISYYDSLGHALRHAYEDGTGWHLELADGGGDVGQYTSLALDAADQPHISYYGGSAALAGLTGVRYAQYDGADWQVELANSDTVSDAVDEGTSLALGKMGEPHIGYGSYDWSDDVMSLKHSFYSGGVWQTEVVDGGSYVGPYPSLATDGQGHPHLSYCYDNSGPDMLKYAWHDGTAWVTETVDLVGQNGCATWLALDASDRPHISYCGGGLKYASKLGVDWITETVPTGDIACGDPSLALDADNWPHIGYRSYNSIDYAYYDGTRWLTETVDSTGNAGLYISLALDSHGHPHLSYYDVTNSALNYAVRDGTGWHREVVVNGGDVGQYSSLALDGKGRPYISFYDATTYDLKLATKDMVRRVYLPIILRNRTDSH